MRMKHEEKRKKIFGLSSCSKRLRRRRKRERQKRERDGSRK